MTVLCLEMEQSQSTGWVTVPLSVLVQSLASTRDLYIPGTIPKSNFWHKGEKVNPVKANFFMAYGNCQHIHLLWAHLTRVYAHLTRLGCQRSLGLCLCYQNACASGDDSRSLGQVKHSTLCPPKLYSDVSGRLIVGACKKRKQETN